MCGLNRLADPVGVDPVPNLEKKPDPTFKEIRYRIWIRPSRRKKTYPAKIHSILRLYYIIITFNSSINSRWILNLNIKTWSGSRHPDPPPCVRCNEGIHISLYKKTLFPLCNKYLWRVFFITFDSALNDYLTFIFALIKLLYSLI